MTTKRKSEFEKWIWSHLKKHWPDPSLLDGLALYEIGFDSDDVRAAFNAGRRSKKKTICAVCKKKI